MFSQKFQKNLLSSVFFMISAVSVIDLGISAGQNQQVVATTTTTDSSAIMNSSSNAATDNVATIAEGEAYLESVRGVVKDYNHNESLALFSAASSVQAPASVKATTLCVQKVPAGSYLSDCLDAKQNGMVSASRSALYFPMFQLNRGAKFVLKVPEQTDGTGKIQDYIGLVVLRHGDGSAYGDIICFAQYLSPQQGQSAANNATVPVQAVSQTETANASVTTTTSAANTPAPAA